MKKKIMILNLILIFMFVFTSFSYALEGVGITPPTPSLDATGQSLAAKIIGTIQIIGYLISVGILVFVGIKFVLASAEERADLKTALPKYFAGAILIALATTIGYWIFNLV